MLRNPILFGAFQRHSDTIGKSMQHILPSVEEGARLITTAIKSRRTVFMCGNGGSAADSQHFATELVARYKKNRTALRAIALTTDSSALTAIGNDYGFENIFKRQIEALGRPGDVLVAFSTSGSSPNVLHAIQQAKKQKMKIVALTGEKGVSLKKISDVCVIVPTAETARIQEVHQLIYHAWCEYIDS